MGWRISASSYSRIKPRIICHSCVSQYAKPQRVDPSEINDHGPVLRSRKGVFSFAVGMQMKGSLLASAASATTVDGSVGRHAKLDSSGLTYIGRSYGVGSSVGLLDDRKKSNDQNNGVWIRHLRHPAVCCEQRIRAVLRLRFKSSSDIVRLSRHCTGAIPKQFS